MAKLKSPSLMHIPIQYLQHTSQKSPEDVRKVQKGSGNVRNIRKVQKGSEMPEMSEKFRKVQEGSEKFRNQKSSERFRILRKYL